jgi:hypothetical protein
MVSLVTTDLLIVTCRTRLLCTLRPPTKLLKPSCKRRRLLFSVKCSYSYRSPAVTSEHIHVTRHSSQNFYNTVYLLRVTLLYTLSPCDDKGHVCVEVPYYIPLDEHRHPSRDLRMLFLKQREWRIDRLHSTNMVSSSLIRMCALTCVLPIWDSADLLLANVYEGGSYRSLSVLREGNIYPPTHLPATNWIEFPYHESTHLSC